MGLVSQPEKKGSISQLQSKSLPCLKCTHEYHHICVVGYFCIYRPNEYWQVLLAETQCPCDKQNGNVKRDVIIDRDPQQKKL
jgi:hypothetical protein